MVKNMSLFRLFPGTYRNPLAAYVVVKGYQKEENEKWSKVIVNKKQAMKLI